MNRKDEFIKWIETNKLKHITPDICASILEQAFLTYENIDIWSLSKETDVSIARNNVLKNKLFKTQNKKEYKIFNAYSKYIQTFIRLFPLVEEHKETVSQENSSELNEKHILDSFKNEFPEVYDFFNEDISAYNFLTIYFHSKEISQSIILDIRSSIIGVKEDNERLQYYSDKDGLLRLAKIGDDQISFSLKNINIDSAISNVDNVIEYFKTHKENVLIAKEETCLGYVFHTKYGFGLIKSKSGDTGAVLFDGCDNVKQMQLIHESIKSISKDEYDKKEINGVNIFKKKILWDKYETSLLIETFWKIESKEINRTEAIKDLSKKLRKKALNQGIEIDEEFRNENGISMQLSNIANCFFPNKFSFHKTHIFSEVAELYKSNKNEYNQILKDAYNFIGNDVDANLDTNKENSNTVASHQAVINNFSNYIEETYIKNHANDGKAQLANKHAIKCIDIANKLNNFLNTYYTDTNLFSCSTRKELIKIYKLLKSKEYLLDEKESKWFDYVLKRYLSFILSSNNDEEISTETQKPDEEYKAILECNFSEGFSYKNPLRKKKFIRVFEENFNKTFIDSDEAFIKKLLATGFESEEKIYLPQIVSSDTHDFLLAYIDKSLKNNPAIYYQSLFQLFSEKLPYFFTEDMLISYLKYILRNTYKFEKEFISLKGTTVDIKKTLIDLFNNKGTPLTKDEIYSELPNIDQSAINETLNDQDFIVNYRGKSYFYKDVFSIEDYELEIIKNFLKEKIDELGQISGEEVYAFIEKNLPDLIETNPGFTELGFKNMLKLKLNSIFDFNGDVISNKGQSVDTKALFTEFCLKKEKFTLDELKCHKEKIHKSRIDFETVFDHSVRISKDEFIRADLINFDVEKIDYALSKCSFNYYFTFNDIINYTDFPYVYYVWNEFVLESYLYKNSKKFKLLHASFNEERPVGAIVPANSSFESFDDFLIKIIKDKKLFTKDKAFTYLKDKGYILTNKIKNIDYLIAKAKKEA